MNPIARWLQKKRVEREMADEISEHLAEKIDQLREDGHSEEEARALARRQFGNTTLQHEDSRAAWGWNTFEQFWQDMHFGCRVLKKAPAVSATAVIVLALGIGMNTAMFSVIKAVLLTALPYPEPERIVQLAQTAKDGHLLHVSGPDFRDWRAQTQTIERMAVYDDGSATISGDFRTRRARMANVSAGFFDVLATQPLIGRTFSAEEQKPGGPPTIILGYELAAAVFGAPASSIQKTVRLNGMAFTVIAVMPPKFTFPDQSQLWIPNDLFPDESGRSAHNYSVLGRLKPRVTLAQAQVDMNVVASRLAKEYPDDKDQGIRVSSLYDLLTDTIRPALYVLWGAVILVLLIACVNISNLQLARSAARRKEIGMRAVLGGSRPRIFRQLLTENVLLGAAGAAVGLMFSELCLKIIKLFAPADVPRIQDLALDAGVLCFTAALALFASTLFGLLPSLHSSRTELNEALKQSTGKGSDIQHKRWGQALVIGEIALAMMLLSGATLLVKSYWKLVHAKIGLKSNGVLVTDITWPVSPDGNSVDGAFVRQVGSQMLTQIQHLPGVQAVAMAKGLPFQFAPDGQFEVEGHSIAADPHLAPDADYHLVTPEYFKVFGIPILRGRVFTVADSRSSQQVAIVNQLFVKQILANEEVLGKRIRFFGMEPKPQFLTIIGVIPDVRESFHRPPRPEVYVEYFQHAGTRMDAALVIRGPATLQPAIERILTSLNHATAVNFESMNNVMSGTVARERFETVLLGVFAGTALLLAIVGVYGLLSYMITHRTSEMGLRIALGATSARIVQLVIKEAGTLVLAGLSIGLAGSLVAARALQAMLSQINTSDPLALFAALFAFTATALVASYLPAYRAAQIDPSQALRAE